MLLAHSLFETRELCRQLIGPRQGVASIFENAETQFLGMDLEGNYQLRKIEMTSISAPI